MPAQYYLSRGQSFFLLRVQTVIAHTPAQTVLRVIQDYAVLSELTAINCQTTLETCAIYIEPDSECLGKIERRFIHAERVFTAKVIYAAEQAEHGRECGYGMAHIGYSAIIPSVREAKAFAARRGTHHAHEQVYMRRQIAAREVIQPRCARNITASGDISSTRCSASSSCSAIYVCRMKRYVFRKSARYRQGRYIPDRS